MKIIDITTTPTTEVIAQTISVLKAGGVVLFPTETTYGAGVDATNQLAVNKLLKYKSRREGKPLSILVANQKMAEQYVEVNEQAQKLYSQFLPGPFTVVSKSLQKVANGVASEFGTLGIRIPDYQLLLELSQKYQKPITATSANASGKKRPYCISDILEGLSEKQKNLIDLVLDAGTLPKNDPSTVIDTTLSVPVTMRSSNRDSQNFSKSDTKITLTSHSEQETKEIAGKLLLKNWNAVSSTGLIIALNGDLGVGKTIFTKGSAEFLKIEDTIKSPTYSYIEEYEYTRHQTSGYFYHLDMWKVSDKSLFEKLEIQKLIKPNAVIVIEWFNQIKEFITPLTKNIPIVEILISDNKINTQRTIVIDETNTDKDLNKNELN